MNVIKTVKEMREFSSSEKYLGKTIAFVPTMGFLHKGHLSLVKKGRKRGDTLVVSIFVNPTQFGPREDYEAYPRDEKKDLELLKKYDVDAVFVPDIAEMYQNNFSTFVVENDLSSGLCGVSRPEHFKGVATVVVKLFNIISPDIALFGQKDYQQVRVIERVVRDLNIDTVIETVPIVRDKYGCALSSRNSYLSEEEFSDALVLNEALCIASLAVNSGERDIDTILNNIKELVMSKTSASIDYVNIVDSDSLKPLKTLNDDIKHVLIVLAVWIGKTRLIDNTLIKLPPKK